MQNREEDEEEAVGPDQMLDEACQLAAQLHELSNNESINLEINKIAESITVCTNLLNNLHATGLSHTLHLDQIAADLNTVHEGHGVSKALLEELQKDIAAMRTAMESMKINTGTVAPVGTRKSTPVTDDESHSLNVETCAESMCPLLDHLEEKTTMMLSQMGNDLEETTQSEDFFKDWVISRASDVAEAHELKDEVDGTTGSDHEQSGRLSGWPSRWEDLLTESAARWRAQDLDADENAALPMCWMRSEPSSFPLSMASYGNGVGQSGSDHHLKGSNSQPSEEGLFPLPFDGDEMWSAASDGHWTMPSHMASIGHTSTSDVHRLQRGQRSGRQWRRSLDANSANEMHQNAKGYEATLSFLQQMSQREHQDDEERPLPSYIQGQQDGKRLPCLLGDKMSPSKACSKEDVNSFVSPFFPLGQEVEDATTLHPPPRCLYPESSEKSCTTSTSESSCRTSEGEFLFRSVDLPMLLGEGPPKISSRGGYYHNAEQRAEWNLQSLGAEEWEVMAMCLQCPGYGDELRQHLMEPIGFWPSKVSSEAATGPVGPILLDRPEDLGATKRRRASLGSLAKAKLEMQSYLRARRRSSLPHILGLPNLTQS